MNLLFLYLHKAVIFYHIYGVIIKRVVVVEVAEVVGVGDLQRVVVAVERFAVQHAVDARQTVDQLLFAVVVAVVGDDLRIGVEEAARRKGGGEQRQRSQFQYAFDFHGVMLRLNR